MTRVDVKSDRQIMRQFRREFAKAIRAEGARVRKAVRLVAPKGKTGKLRKNVKMRLKWDAQGPYVRIFTSARRITKNEDGTVTMFRYGLAVQQDRDYLNKGLDRVPRR